MSHTERKFLPYLQIRPNDTRIIAEMPRCVNSYFTIVRFSKENPGKCNISGILYYALCVFGSGPCVRLRCITQPINAPDTEPDALQWP